MDVEFIVRLRELKRAFRRLSARLPDESEAGAEFVLFNVGESSLEILVQETAEGLTAAVASSPVLCGISRIPPSYGRSIVGLDLSVFRWQTREQGLFLHGPIQDL